MNPFQNISIEEAFALAEAEAKLNNALAEAQQRFEQAVPPDRLNENWRFGKPHQYAAELIEMAQSGQEVQASMNVDAPKGVVAESISPEDEDLKQTLMLMPTIGSDALLGLHIKRFGTGYCIMLEPGAVIEKPILITYEVSSGLCMPSTYVMAAEGSQATIIERHVCRGHAGIFCTRHFSLAEGAKLSVRLTECGDSSTRAFNITNIQNMGGVFSQMISHEGHAWAREETIGEIYSSAEGTAIHLFGANRLRGNSVVDQHTRQIHHVGGAYSNLLYKNVLDENATAIFAGNIYVAPGAHQTDAYQANRNMLLSERATVHSLPGLEILADKVKCSHGSASAPMDDEQLFYLCSRGISKHDAQLLVAEGFLADVQAQFDSVSV